MAPLEILGITAAVLAMGALIAALLAWHAARGAQARCESLEVTLAAMRREMEMVASISARTGRRVQRVEHEFSGVAERVDLVEARGGAAPAPTLDQAIDWARQGAEPERIAQQFGLSSGEAELVARLHGAGKSA